MHPVWAQRREEVVSDGLVSPDVFPHMVERLGELGRPSQHALETAASGRHVSLSLQGWLSHLERKHAETSATCLEVERQVLPACLAPGPGEQRPLGAGGGGPVAAPGGASAGLRACAPRSFPTRATHAVGVKRPWCGHRGQGDPWPGGGCRGDVSRPAQAVLDCRRSLPADWARAAPRRQACHGPPEGRSHTRQAQCLALRDAWSAQGPHGWGTGADARGRPTRWRRALRPRGER